MLYEVITDLENKQSVAELLELAREADSTRIFIGSENRLFALSGSSVIASPYRDRERRVLGGVGVIGPTRLNYARVVPMVDFTVITSYSIHYTKLYDGPSLRPQNPHKSRQRFPSLPGSIAAQSMPVRWS